MRRHRFVIVGSLTFAVALGVTALACSDDPNRPPAASSGATVSSGGGSSSTSGSGSVDGSVRADGSSGGSDGGTSSGSTSGFIETGFRATVDSVATEFDVTPTAVRQSAGYVVEMSGKNAAGDELKITMTNGSGMVAPGAYDCTGGSGNAYSVISYTTANGAETWSALASGACTVGMQSIDNHAGGIAVGTFTATAQKGGSPDKIFTNGQFRLSLD